MLSRILFGPALAVAFVLPCSMAQPQDLSPAPAGDESILFQDIPSVYGASKFEQKTSEAPSSVSIITASDIQHYGYRTLADILRSVRGFYTTYDRNYTYAGVRGFGRPGDYNTRVLLLVDGHRINDNIFSQAFIGTESIVEVDLIDRVEIIRGPGSSLYGTGAFFGVINVITKRGRNVAGTELSAAAGSQETYKGRATYGQRLSGGGDLLLSVTGYHSNGQSSLFFPDFANPSTNNGYAENLDQDRYTNLFASASFGDFVLQAGSITRKKDIPTASFDTVFDAVGTNTTDDRQYLDLRFAHSYGTRGDVSARVYYDRYGYDGNYLLAPAPGTPNADTARGQWWGTELQYGVALTKQHRLTVGAEYVDNFQQNQTNYDVSPYQLNLDAQNSSHSFGVYAQDEFRPIDTLILDIGVRYDDSYGRASSTNPRFAAIWLPRAGTALKLLYGTAFRAPNAFELYYGGASSTLNTLNPALKPEKIKTTELVWEQELAQHWQSSVSAYRYRIDDLISLVDDPNDPTKSMYVNSEPVDAHGIGLEVGWRPPSGYEVRASYTYQDAETTSSGQRLSNSPRQMVKANFLAPVFSSRMTAGLEVQYVGPRLTMNNDTAGGYTVVNLTLLARQLWHQVDLSASVYNLFGHRYFDPAGGNMVQDQIQQDGTVFLVKATCRF